MNLEVNFPKGLHPLAQGCVHQGVCLSGFVTQLGAERRTEGKLPVTHSKVAQNKRPEMAYVVILPLRNVLYGFPGPRETLDGVFLPSTSP